MRDPIRIGSSGRLRVQFLDSDLQPIEATSVTVDLYAPGDVPGTDSPTVTGLVPTYLGNGVFEVTVTATSPEGTWSDRWTGTILGTVTVSDSIFEVLGSGEIVAYPIHGLQANTLVEVLLDATISSTSGTALSDDEVIRFTTTYSPLYSSVRKVRLDAGGVLSNVPDDVINLAILEASIEADVLNFRASVINNNVFTHARRQFVTCMAALNVAENIQASRGGVRSKMLADFKVDYDTSAVSDLLDKLGDCIRKWKDQVQAGGGARAIRNPRMVVKGELDPDRPPAGRGWFGHRNGETPIGNMKYRASGSRRWRTGWSINKNGGGTDW
jgi:hypothetical protein